MPRVVTIDFHVTSECSQECPYCWGPQEVPAVDTATALAIEARDVSFAYRKGEPTMHATDVVIVAERFQFAVQIRGTPEQRVVERWPFRAELASMG